MAVCARIAYTCGKEGKIAMVCSLYEKRVDWQNLCDSWKSDGRPRF